MSAPLSPASLLASRSRVELLNLLQRGGPSTIDVLTKATGLHANTVREHLTRLIEGGYVRGEPEVRTSRGRPRIIYRVTGAADVLTDPAASRKLEQAIAQATLSHALVHAFDDEAQGPARAVAAGRTVGKSLPPPAGLPRRGAARGQQRRSRELLALEAHLSSFGFDPEYDDAADTFHLWRCPFLELARERTEIVCAVHHGLAQGVLDQAGGGYDVEQLTPFVGPHHCTLSVRPT